MNWEKIDAEYEKSRQRQKRRKKRRLILKLLLKGELWKIWGMQSSIYSFDDALTFEYDMYPVVLRDNDYTIDCSVFVKGKLAYTYYDESAITCLHMAKKYIDEYIKDENDD